MFAFAIDRCGSRFNFLGCTEDTLSGRGRRCCLAYTTFQRTTTCLSCRGKRWSLSAVNVHLQPATGRFAGDKVTVVLSVVFFVMSRFFFCRFKSFALLVNVWRTLVASVISNGSISVLRFKKLDKFHFLVFSHRCRFALHNVNFGSTKRGRKIYECLVQTYPERLELWKGYIAAETETGHAQEARNLLERLVSVCA